MNDEVKPGKILRNMFSELFPLEDYDNQRTTENVCKILNYYYGETKYTDLGLTGTGIYVNNEQCWSFNWKGAFSYPSSDQLGKQLLKFINQEILLFKLELLSN